MAPRLALAATARALAGGADPSLDGIDVQICDRGRAALELLQEARVYAHHLNRSLWDFALELDALRHGGLLHSDLRWLVCKGYLEQASEILPGEGEQRQFAGAGALTFTETSCFVLTDSGERMLRSAAGQAAAAPAPLRANGANGANGRSHRDAPAAVENVLPCWDRERQELRVGPKVVKQFKVPAPNQEVVLAVFHEEGWPVRIDDPLPPRPDLEPKRRLHDTINSLNRNQKNPLLRFLGDGTGQGVRWEFSENLEVAGCV